MKTRILIVIIFCFGWMFLKAQVSIDVCAGESVYLHVASPALSVVQWQHMGTGTVFMDIPGATSDTLFISSIQSSDFYRTKITGQECDPYFTEVKSITVHPTPIVSFTGLHTTYCSTDASDTLIATPTGGIFSGNGMNGSIFKPAIAGAGTQSISYTYISTHGCVGTDTQNVQVHAG